jgi:hypothetical protein
MFACGDKGYGLKPLSSGGAAEGGVSDTGGTLGTGAGGTTGIGDIDGGDSEAGVAIDGGGTVGAGGIGGGTGGAGGSTTAVVSYAQTIAPMMKASCTQSVCHSSSKQAGGYAFDTYDTMKAGAADAIKAIQAGDMPPNGGFSPTDLKNLQDWVTQGSLNN